MLLSKSKYKLGLECPRHMWMHLHREDEVEDHGPAMQFIFDQGHNVGAHAQSLYPEGVDVSQQTDDFGEHLKKTQELLQERKPLFEAGIKADGLYARPDILRPVNDNEWDIIEVKSSTKVKDDHVKDVAFQKHVYEQAGLTINNCYLMHVNSDYTKNGEIESEELLVKEDITDDVEQEDDVAEKAQNLLRIAKNSEPPDVCLGNGCGNKLDCVDACHDFLPSQGHVFELYYGGKKSMNLLQEDVLHIEHIPPDYDLTQKQEIQKQCAETGEPYIDKDRIQQFLDEITYPVYYLDFEAFNAAVPVYDGTTPWQHVPFQFSLHIQHEPGGDLEHVEYLHNSPSDPRESLLEELQDAIGDTGSVIVYSKSFETRQLRDMADAYPQYKDWVETVIDRIVDLIEPFRNFHYYHPDQQGSCSLKAVLPAVTGEYYKHLDVDSGDLSAAIYYNHIFNQDGLDDETRENLLEYCELDTEGMVWIIEELRELAGYTG